ncbi:MAG: hypothetical protein JO361_04370 [Gammaproteobacteria bacterium]|nr:hypothetical protein [Gammaproteobacteria bacterium]
MKLRASGARRSALLPAAQTPVIAAGRTASAGEVDAVLAIVRRQDALESLERAG